MKYLPKSKLGLIFAAIYILLWLVPLYFLLFGTGGAHGDGILFVISVMVLLFPWSLMMFTVMDFIKSDLLAMLMVVILAVLNLLLLYLLGAFISHKFNSGSKKSHIDLFGEAKDK